MAGKSKTSGVYPLTSGGGTLKRPRKPGGATPQKRRRKTWFQNNGIRYGEPIPSVATEATE